MDNKERKEFWDTLCSLDGKDLTLDSQLLCEKIKYPPFLYRYRKIEKKTIDAFKNDKLYFSTSDYYDDPFDTYLQIDFKSIYEQMKATEQLKSEAVKKFIKLCEDTNVNPEKTAAVIHKIENSSTDEMFTVLANFLKSEIQPQLQRRTQSICFSESGINEAMWLKYADQYRGFCLMFSLRAEDDNKFHCGKYEKCAKCGVNMHTPLYPIYYSEDRYDATKYCYNLAHEYFLSKVYPTLIKEEIVKQLDPCIWEAQRATLIKSKCHEYDREWRMILSNPNKPPVMMEWVPYGIIFGLRICEGDKNNLADIAMKKGIHIYQSFIDDYGKLDAYEIKYSKTQGEN